ncbi:TetR family transcriptional regulator [Burkholderia cenocepacia]|uniref:TetR family transcriptional regulator n=1 Tax=Burkholderia cenocepacia TaxID=95486 RepID=UPI002AB0DD2C|nr:TetR family transcriptional regulator [Burkholderia cenocepacia]
MDNPTRSERTRTAAIQAALAILERDGPGKLTFDAISRESGISKGGLMHQFRTKGDVLNALMEHQQDTYQRFQRDYLAARDPAEAQPTLAAQIATMREVIEQQPSAALAIMAALVEDPAPLQTVRETDAENVKRMTAESRDPELALLRWKAAWGLALSAMFGLCPLSADERARLFDRLLDETQWPSGGSDTVQRGRPAAKTPRKK